MYLVLITLTMYLPSSFMYSTAVNSLYVSSVSSSRADFTCKEIKSAKIIITVEFYEYPIDCTCITVTLSQQRWPSIINGSPYNLEHTCLLLCQTFLVFDFTPASTAVGVSMLSVTSREALLKHIELDILREVD